MNSLTVLLTAAAVAFGLSRWFRLPPIPLLIIAGICIRVGADYWSIELPKILLGEMIEVGLAVLVFTCGVDLSPKSMKGNVRGTIIVAIAQFIILGAASIGMSYALGYPFTDALFD